MTNFIVILIMTCNIQTGMVIYDMIENRVYHNDIPINIQLAAFESEIIPIIAARNHECTKT